MMVTEKRNRPELWGKIYELFEQNQFTQALPVATQLAEVYPEDPYALVSLSVCYSGTNQTNLAEAVLLNAYKRFPGHRTVLFHLAEAQYRLRRYEQSEQTYRKALAATPEQYTGERAACYNGLGVVYLQQEKRDLALTMWQEAVRLDPASASARRNLDDFNSTYRDTSGHSSTFDDLSRFQRYQTENYLVGHGKKEFQSWEEREQVLDAISEAWNKHFAPKVKQIDTMTRAQKSELFRKVKIDFKNGNE
jgi:tetratricopeptide (TPR) repeat protein